MSEYKLGLCSISFRDNPPEEILKEMQKCGLNFIEWGSDVHAQKDDIKRLEEIAKLQKKYGIICSSYGTYFRIGVTPEEEFEAYINAARILGTDILRLWCGNKNSEDYSLEEKNALFEECRKLASIAEKNNVTICMECHNGTFTNTKEAAFELMQAVNSKNFRMYWQPNQLKSFEENVAYASLLSGYTEHIHVFNWSEDKRFLLADGIDIWKKYLECFSCDKTLLLEFMPDDKIESLMVESMALRKIAEVE